MSQAENEEHQTQAVSDEPKRRSGRDVSSEEATRPNAKASAMSGDFCLMTVPFMVTVKKFGGYQGRNHFGTDKTELALRTFIYDRV